MEIGYMKRAVTKQFREFCLAKYPALQDSERLRRLFRYLCFSCFYDEDTDNLVVSHGVLHNECDPDSSLIHFNALELLVEMKARVLPNLEWTMPVWGQAWNGKARQVLNSGFDAEMQKALEDELKVRFDTRNFTGMVDFITGNGYQRYRRSHVVPSVATEKTEVLEKGNLNPTQNKIATYLHTQVNGGMLFPPRYKRNWDEVHAAVATLPKASQAVQHRILTNILEQPEIIYAPSEEARTPRLHACVDSVVGLKSTVRKAFCGGWTECDLKSSQFAILAAKLNAPLAQAFIAEGGSLWRSFHFHTHGINEEPSAELKKAYKEAIYGIAFGMSVEDSWNPDTGKKDRRGLKSRLQKNGVESLLSHSIISELLTLRERWYEQIKRDGGAADVWGNFHRITKSSGSERSRWHGSVAATVIQSIELEIIAPIFDVANKYGDTYKFIITMFQHDGGCISFSDLQYKERIQRFMQEAVQARAKELGVSTKLEFTDLP